MRRIGETPNPGAPSHCNPLEPNLYNVWPTWLDLAHRKLDAAVFAAYGWKEDPATVSDQEILARLLALNLAR